MRKYRMLAFGTLCAVCFAGYVNAGPLFVGSVSAASGWYDINKIWDGDDDVLCWAAAAGNVLAYTGWNGGMTANGIFQHYRDHWTDGTGNTWVGIEWFFEGTTTGSMPGTATQDVPGGGGFYAGQWAGAAFQPSPINDYTNSWGNLTWYVDRWNDADTTNDSGGVYLFLRGTSYNHWVTLWGYDLIDTTTKYIYITDSDDAVSKLQKYQLDDSGGMLYLHDYFSSTAGYYLDGVFRLAAGPDGIVPNPPIPEPTTLLLLASGFSVLRIWIRRRKR